MFASGSQRFPMKSARSIETDMSLLNLLTGPTTLQCCRGNSLTQRPAQFRQIFTRQDVLAIQFVLDKRLWGAFSAQQNTHPIRRKFLWSLPESPLLGSPFYTRILSDDSSSRPLPRSG